MTLRSDQRGQFSYALDEETIHLRRMDKTKGFGLGVASQWRRSEVSAHTAPRAAVPCRWP